MYSTFALAFTFPVSKDEISLTMIVERRIPNAERGALGIRIPVCWTAQKNIVVLGLDDAHLLLSRLQPHRI